MDGIPFSAIYCPITKIGVQIRVHSTEKCEKLAFSGFAGSGEKL